MRADYVERAAEADLAAELACTWTVTLDAAGLSLLPDGCLDLLWIDSGRLVICGPETAAWRTSLPAGTTAVGVRFRPGVAPAVLGMPVSPLRELRVGMQDVWGAGASHLSERLGEAPDPGARVGILQAAVRARLADGPPVDRVARAVARRLVAPPPGARGGVAGLAADLGYSERQLHRRSVAAFGYGPAVLARILRLQRFLALARSGAGPVGVAALAAAAGYADGPHLARECRALAGATPSELVARETSDPFTTASDPPGTLAAPTS